MEQWNKFLHRTFQTTFHVPENPSFVVTKTKKVMHPWVRGVVKAGSTASGLGLEVDRSVAGFRRANEVWKWIISGRDCGGERA